MVPFVVPATKTPHDALFKSVSLQPESATAKRPSCSTYCRPSMSRRATGRGEHVAMSARASGGFCLRLTPERREQPPSRDEAGYCFARGVRQL